VILTVGNYKIATIYDKLTILQKQTGYVKVICGIVSDIKGKNIEVVRLGYDDDRVHGLSVVYHYRVLVSS
jgi:hypothetical protein